MDLDSIENPALPRFGSDSFLVRMRGLEPPRCHHHRLLRPARLPVPPHPLINGLAIMRMRFRECQEGGLAALAFGKLKRIEQSTSTLLDIKFAFSSVLNLSVVRNARKASPLSITSSISYVKTICVNSTAILSSVETNALVGRNKPVSQAQTTPRPAIVPAPIASIMAVHKLVALIAPFPVGAAPTSIPIPITAAPTII